MPDILHHFHIEASPSKVFEVISTPKGLNAWWPKDSTGSPGLGESYGFDFGPGYYWKAQVEVFEQDQVISWKMTEADEDWTGTLVGFRLTAKEGPGTIVEFFNTGWKEANEHYRRSSFCWAMYLRVLKRYIEFGEEVPYEQRNFV